jgi:flavin-dependent dehydrogenase
VCDVAVIGGGPAGSTAATLLAQKGYAVVLIDKQRHPRPAVGESLLPDMWKYADLLGVTPVLEGEGFVRKAGGIVQWEGATRQIAFRDFGYDRPALHVERDRFDHLLLEHARTSGAQVFEDVAVNRVSFQEAGPVELAWRRTAGEEAGCLHCRYVVDASGQNAVVARQLGLREIHGAFQFLCVWGYFTGADYLSADGALHPAQEVLRTPPVTYVTSLFDGETGAHEGGWYIPLRASTSVGMMVPLARTSSISGGLPAWQQFFDEQCARLPRYAALLRPAQFVRGSLRVIRDYSYRASRMAGPGYFLAGDAAGFVDPIFSNGVTLALYSGTTAAWAIDAALAQAAQSGLVAAYYDSQLRSRIDLAHQLALPPVVTAHRPGAEVLRAYDFVDRQLLLLMQSASALVARSGNVAAMTGQRALEEESKQYVHTLQPANSGN